MNPERICYGCFQDKEPGLICPHCGFDQQEEQPYLALPLGTLLNGRYMLGKVLGIGGFGITYLGYDLTLEIKVAVKEYMPSSVATRHADRYSVTLTGRVEAEYQYGMERFLEEAKILAKLQNTPNIVSVQNYFKENNTAYFVMDYIDGMSLKAYLKSQGEKIPFAQALAILQPIMEALVQVHGLNLLHRDISPDNIYITSRGESRLLDFGAARSALGDGKSVSVILKHGYAPEEQYSSHGNQGPWTDVYTMGATLYRCITGQLPPDSVDRIRGDTLKPPSELGIPLPPMAENAIMKALSVKAEDRFPNMEAFIKALSGQAFTQEKVTFGGSQRTRTTAYGQTVGGGTCGDGRRSSVLSKCIAYCQTNPLIAGVFGGGLLAIAALCILLPTLLSGGGEAVSTSGGENLPSVSVPQKTPDAGAEPSHFSISTPSAPPVLSTPLPAVEMETRDLGILNASIDIPADYTASADGFSFAQEERGCAITTSFLWNASVPIYSLSDMAENREAIIAYLMAGFGVSEYSILSSDWETIEGQEAFQIHVEGTDDNGVSMELFYLAVQGSNPFGCYSLVGACSKGDEAGREEVQNILQTFRCLGEPDTTYSMWYSETIGLKIIIDDSLALGSVWETEIPLRTDTAEVIVIYPTEAAREAGLGSVDSSDSGGVEVGYLSEYGYSAPEELLDAHADSISAADGTVGERYTAFTGGADWLCQNYAIDAYSFSSAAAIIDGQCIYLSAMYNDSNQKAVVELCNQVMASVRPW